MKKAIALILFVILLSGCSLLTMNNPFYKADPVDISAETSTTSSTSTSTSTSSTSTTTTTTTIAVVYNISYKNVSDTINNNPTSYTINDNVVLNDIVRAGYKFEGWFDTRVFGDRIYGWNAGDRTGDITLGAKWGSITYTVKFNANGGSGTMEDQTFTYNNSQTLKTCTFTAPDDLKFGYWTFEADGSGRSCEDGETILNLASTDGATVTLYAQWVDKFTHKISYRNLNGADNSANPKTFKETDNVTLQNITLSGYTFGGWYDAQTGGNKMTGWAAGWQQNDVVVYARWTPITYTVKFDSNGGSGYMSNMSFVYGEPQSLLANGYTAPDGYNGFDCWNTAADGSGTDYQNTETVSNLTGTNGTIVILYAQWQPVIYNIVYRNVSGAANNNPLTYTVKDNVVFTAVSKDGYAFDGWYSMETGGSEITGWNAGDCIGEIELWARWSNLVYQIVYKDQGGEPFSGVHGSGYPTTHTYGEETALVAPTNGIGWGFGGWYKNSDCTGSAITKIGASEREVTLYAKWIEKWDINNEGNFVHGNKVYLKTGLNTVISTSTVFPCDISESKSSFYSVREQVRLSPYSIGKYEMTQEFFMAVMGKNPSSNSAALGDGETDKLLRPVDNVSLYDVMAFCNKLSLLMDKQPCYSVKINGQEIDWETLRNEDIPTKNGDHNVTDPWNAATVNMSANGYRIPTICEWECAARGGRYDDQTSWRYLFSGSDNLDYVAWHKDISNNHIWEVGLKTANSLDLYDMSGNVSEMCWDFFNLNITINDDVYMVDGIVTNPIITDGAQRCNRGGKANSNTQNDFKVYNFSSHAANYATSYLGFRLASSEVR